MGGASHHCEPPLIDTGLIGTGLIGTGGVHQGPSLPSRESMYRLCAEV